ncbi:MAG: membrane protein, partial [Rhodospirillaceae bacterium BRH_c57]
KLRRSQQRIRNLGFFEDVQVTNAPSETAPDRTVVQVDVQERSTGELSFGVGWSSGMGALFDISLRERNLLGRGQDLRSKLTLAQRRQEIDLSFTEPYFLDRPLAAGFDLFHTRTDLQDESSYDTRETGAALRLGFNYTDRLTQGLKYTVSRTSIENVPPGAAQAIIDSLGTTTVSMVSQTLTYDRRDSTIDPREGYFARLSNDVAGLGGSERFLRTTIDGGQYFPVTDNITLALQGTAGIVAGLGKDVRFNRNYYLGGDTLRGFEYGGASPRDVATGDVLGGKWMAAASAELRFPLGLPQELGLTGKAFTDVGMIGSPDGTNRYNIHTSTAPRASVGVGLVWVSPMGPVSIDLAQALLKEDWDRTEFFRFNFGTRF